MAPFICCGLRKAPSPDTSPVRVVNNSQTKGRFKLSTNTPTPTSTASPGDIEPIREIFASVSNDGRLHDSPTSSRHKRHLRADSKASIRRKESTKNLHDIARKVQKRLSRESGFSKRSSNKKLRSSVSTEDTERRKELKRALHQRLRSEILEDNADTENDYDEDAVPIQTPRSTWGRHQGSIHISPRHLSKALGRSESPGPTMQMPEGVQARPQSYVPRSTAGTLSRMLTQRGSHLTGSAEDDATGTAGRQSPKRMKSTKKYIFSDETLEEPGDIYQTALDRSDTVIRVPGPPAPVNIGPPKFMDSLGIPSSPDIPPQRRDSITESVAGPDWHLSFSGSTLQSPAQDVGGLPRDSSLEHAESTLLSPVAPIRPLWQRGASGVLGPSVYERRFSWNHDHCDPANEESNFGGVDGKKSNSRTRTHSEGSVPASVHLYNMHIAQRLATESSQRLAPRGITSSVSSPHLQGQPSSDLSFGSTPEHLSLRPHRHASSSGFASAKVPSHWGTPRTHAASSVYTSGASLSSLPTSHRSSIHHVISLSDRLTPYESNLDIISVPASRPKSIDVLRLEQKTADTSFHSSKESLTMRELAAAETRISPISRRGTEPKASHFKERFSKEDFDEIAAEIARTNPRRRVPINLDGSGEGSSDRSRDSRFSVVIGEGRSAWDRALREHAEEDDKLLRTNLGSELRRENDQHEGMKSTKGKGLRSKFHQVQDRLAVESPYSNIQAHLGAYRLPTRSESPARPFSHKPNRTVSPSTSAWSRFPSHTRVERSSSPAGEADQVFARDFAQEALNSEVAPDANSRPRPHRHFSPLHLSKKPRSMNFARLRDNIIRLYRTQSLELRSKSAYDSRNHRSSISEGGLTEYPELEMLAPISPPLPAHVSSPRRSPAADIDPLVQKVAHSQGVYSHRGAESWSKLYEDCVVDPRSRPMASPRSHSRVHTEKIGTEDTTVGCERKSGEVRASTLDFKTLLEESERRAREKIMRRNVSGA